MSTVALVGWAHIVSLQPGRLLVLAPLAMDLILSLISLPRRRLRPAAICPLQLLDDIQHLKKIPALLLSHKSFACGTHLGRCPCLQLCVQFGEIEQDDHGGERDMGFFFTRHGNRFLRTLQLYVATGRGSAMVVSSHRLRCTARRWC
jgi:hypothetical protein